MVRTKYPKAMFCSKKTNFRLVYVILFLTSAMVLVALKVHKNIWGSFLTKDVNSKTLGELIYIGK